MNARDRLLAYLRQTGLSTARAEANLNAFAHELAEQQRAVDFDWYEEHAEGAVMARDYLADLIDPHVRPASSEEKTA
ncbi:hypothetical protein L0F81_17225 [Streptomyces tricolor]|uniref:Uncharacterized protein n=1 Tax=Streptomyces tricolor TaxID=68277 RepID=A0ABS9JHI2_9ACTN|nr:hypothetical protein [Streptomyces tricolor]MCG0065016.1 hypothetical protein [Streptomyces tricolor]